MSQTSDLNQFPAGLAPRESHGVPSDGRGITAGGAVRRCARLRLRGYPVLLGPVCHLTETKPTPTKTGLKWTCFCDLVLAAKKPALLLCMCPFLSTCWCCCFVRNPVQSVFCNLCLFDIPSAVQTMTCKQWFVQRLLKRHT